jgi:hypothetical protein
MSGGAFRIRLGSHSDCLCRLFASETAISGRVLHSKDTITNPTQSRKKILYIDLILISEWCCRRPREGPRKGASLGRGMFRVVEQIWVPDVTRGGLRCAFSCRHHTVQQLKRLPRSSVSSFNRFHNTSYSIRTLEIEKVTFNFLITCWTKVDQLG